jgi:hypothetical protein
VPEIIRVVIDTNHKKKKSFGFLPELPIFMYHIGKAHPRAQRQIGVASGRKPTRFVRR